MPARQRAHVLESAPDPLAHPARQNVGALRAGPLEHVHRHIDLATRSLQGKGPDQAGQGIGDAGMPGHVGRAGVAAISQDQRCELHQRRGGLAAIALQIARRRHRIVIEVEDARIDEIDERFHRQAPTADHIDQRRGHGMAGNIATCLAVQHVAPPLQAHLPRQRGRDAFAHGGDFDIEGIKRHQVGTKRRGREKARQPAVLVRRAHQFLAGLERVGHLMPHDGLCPYRPCQLRRPSIPGTAPVSKVERHSRSTGCPPFPIRCPIRAAIAHHGAFRRRRTRGRPRAPTETCGIPGR